ncbi:MAG: PaaI family thioesterase [Acidobacteria bacterium]|nr:PaaI family thioesterase [Acidobacteriota bacterium]
MSNDLHYKKLENLYHNAQCNEYYKPAIKIFEARAELIIPVQEKFFHAANAVHGSVYFKALDDAAFFACNSLVTEYLVLTANFNLYLLKPISTGVLMATGKVLNNLGSSFVAESVLYNSQDEEIARATGTFVKSKIKLTEEMGYK